MSETVRVLSSPEMGGRGLGTEGIDRAAAYLEESFRNNGLKPVDEKYLQDWTEEIVGLRQTVRLKNIVGIVPGSDPVLSKECVVVGAHYDHLGTGWPEARAHQKGEIHPGADDNASGVGILIELARETVTAKEKPLRSLVFAAFTAEEAEKRGSRHFVERLGRYCADGALAMLNLDTTGRLSGDKLYVIGWNSSMAWEPLLKEAASSSGLSVELVREDLDSSDQTSFHEAGIPAVQFFSGPHEDYHRPSDTPEKLNYGGMEKIVSFVSTVIGHLGRRTEPLQFTAPEQPAPKKQELKTERRSGLGIVPDFAFQGKGCRISGTVPGSPAEAAGMKQGDVITGINELEISGLKDLSSALKSLEPGQRVEIRFFRNGREMSVETVTAPR